MIAGVWYPRRLVIGEIAALLPRRFPVAPRPAVHSVEGLEGSVGDGGSEMEDFHYGVCPFCGFWGVGGRGLLW